MHFIELENFKLKILSMNFRKLFRFFGKYMYWTFSRAVLNSPVLGNKAVSKRIDFPVFLSNSKLHVQELFCLVYSAVESFSSKLQNFAWSSTKNVFSLLNWFAHQYQIFCNFTSKFKTWKGFGINFMSHDLCQAQGSFSNFGKRSDIDVSNLAL